MIEACCGLDIVKDIANERYYVLLPLIKKKICFNNNVQNCY